MVLGGRLTAPCAKPVDATKGKAKDLWIQDRIVLVECGSSKKALESDFLQTEMLGHGNKKMTGAELMAVIGFFLMLMGTIAGVWRRVETRVDKAKKEAMETANSASLKVDLVSAQLQEHRLHVAQEYVSKAGNRELMDQVMDAISAVRQSVDGLSGRVARILENQAKGNARPRA